MQSDGEILIGGLFTAIDGALRNRVGRLNADGRLDLGFNVGVGLGSGANGPVSTIAVQIDGKILLGGDFTLVNGVTRNRITRLNTDGTVDPTINFGTGANAAVSSIVLQPDRKIILVGGFTEYDSVPRKHIARIHGGSISGAGSIAFQNPVYTANEVGTNAVITCVDPGDFGRCHRRLCHAGIDATPGIDSQRGGPITFREGETFGSFSIPLGDDRDVEGEERVKLILSNPASGAVLGGLPNATLIIISDDSKIGFSSANYSIIENTSAQSASLTVVRRGDTSGTASVDFLTADGSATAGVDYDARQETLVFVPGEVSKTFSITIRDDVSVEGNETVDLILTNLTGKAEFDRSQSTLVLVDNDFGPGELSFSDFAYSVRENGTNAVITVRRRSGSTGVVSVSARRPVEPPRLTSIMRSLKASFRSPTVNLTRALAYAFSTTRMSKATKRLTLPCQIRAEEPPSAGHPPLLWRSLKPMWDRAVSMSVSTQASARMVRFGRCSSRRRGEWLWAARSPASMLSLCQELPGWRPTVPLI